MKTTLDVLNRPLQKRRVEHEQERRKKQSGSFLARNSKWFLIVFANIVIVVFDVLAVSAVYTLTNGNLVLCALALLPTGVPVIMWEFGWLYPLASAEQKKRATVGIGLGAGSALIVGMLSVLTALAPESWLNVISIVMLAWCVIVVLIHAYQAAMFFYKDPVIQREHDLQVAISEQGYQRDTIRHSRSILQDVRVVLEEESALRKEFGDASVDRALELLMGLEEKTGKDLNGDGFIGKPPVGNHHDIPAMASTATQTVRTTNGNGYHPEPTRQPAPINRFATDPTSGDEE